MRKPGWTKKRDHFTDILEEKILDNVRKISSEKKLSEKEVVNQLITDGLKYRELKRKYSVIDTRDVWDNRFYYLKIEAGYLYYRLRVKELLDEIKSLSMMATGIAKELELCYNMLESCGKDLEERKDNLKELQKGLKKYVEEYVLPDEIELEEKRYADDKTVIESIKKILETYEKVIEDEKVSKREL
jgi:hypothetical protein